MRGGGSLFPARIRRLTGLPVRTALPAGKCPADSAKEIKARSTNLPRMRLLSPGKHVLLLQERLITQSPGRQDHRPRGIPADAQDPIGPERPEDARRLNQASRNHEERPDLLEPVLSFQTRQVDRLQGIAFPFHQASFQPPAAAHKQDLVSRVPFFKRFRQGQGREQVPPGPPSGDQYFHCAS